MGESWSRPPAKAFCGIKLWRCHTCALWSPKQNTVTQRSQINFSILKSCIVTKKVCGRGVVFEGSVYREMVSGLLFFFFFLSSCRRSSCLRRRVALMFFGLFRHRVFKLTLKTKSKQASSQDESMEKLPSISNYSPPSRAEVCVSVFLKNI